MSEQLLRAYATSYGISSICFRFFKRLRPAPRSQVPLLRSRQYFCRALHLWRRCYDFWDGLQSRDFIFVKDLAEAIAGAASTPDQADGIYNLCTGRSSTLLDLVDILKDAYPEVPEIQFAEDRAGDIKHSLGKPEAAREGLKFEANTPFKDGIRELLDSLVAE